MPNAARTLAGFLTLFLGLQAFAVVPAGVSTAGLDCNEAPQALDGRDSSQYAYFTDLLQRAQQAPISDFLKLWYPERNKNVDHSYFLDCQPQPFAAVDTDRDGCAPDTLYSWQTSAKLSAIRQSFVDGQDWQGQANPGNNGLWATISAVSTYSYGSTPVRLKIKPGIQYNKNLMNVPGSIAYSGGYLQDFIIYDENVVESYSFGTPELYDEIVRDILRISSGQPYISYVDPSGSNYTGMDRVYHAGVPERGPQDEAVLRTRLTQMLAIIINNQGQIVYSKNACRNRQATYMTNRPTYINTYTPQ